MLSTDDVSRLDDLVSDYPQLEGIIADMAGYLDKPQEVVGMFSEALKILDENTVHYMMDEMQKDIDNKNELINKQDEMIKELREQNEDKNEQINKQNQQIAELLDAFKQSQEEIAELRKLIEK